MLAGDDEINALLAEMRGGGGASTNSNSERASPSRSKPKKDKKKASTTASSSRNDAPPQDSRLIHPLTVEWPNCLRLKESLEEGKCSGWKEGKKGEGDDVEVLRMIGTDTCRVCDKSRAFHRLTVSKKIKKKVPRNLPLLVFCHARNIRCVASEDTKQAFQAMEATSTKTLELIQEAQKAQTISPADLLSMQEKATELREVIRLRKNDAQKTKKDDLLAWRLQVMMKADSLYYRAYYASLTDSDIEMSAKVPDPPVYFSFPGMAWKVSHQSATNLIQELDPSTKELLVETMGVFTYPHTFGDSDQDDDSSSNSSQGQRLQKFCNPLHSLWQHRFYEMARHFLLDYSSRRPSATLLQAMNKATIRTGNMHEQFAQHETLSPNPLLADYRDVARDFPASLYAYATPSPYALQQLTIQLRKKHVIEVGAGTGYWAALLQHHGIDIQAYDISPPGDYSDNEYHSEVPAFTNVQQLDASRSATSTTTSGKDDALFLCYPPPGTDMAFSALQSFRGDMVVHVGEWMGLTGDTAFESLILQTFACQTYISLPIWGTDAAYVTVWIRRKHGASRKNNHDGNDNDNDSINIAIGGCSCCTRKVATHRCRFARPLQYCSRVCFDAHRATRKGMLLLHMIDIGDDLDIEWGNAQHFLDLTTSTRISTQVEQGRKRKKKRRRKK